MNLLFKLNLVSDVSVVVDTSGELFGYKLHVFNRVVILEIMMIMKIIMMMMMKIIVTTSYYFFPSVKNLALDKQATACQLSVVQSS